MANFYASTEPLVAAPPSSLETEERMVRVPRGTHLRLVGPPSLEPTEIGMHPAVVQVAITAGQSHIPTL
jgi:hypothetical protein